MVFAAALVVAVPAVVWAGVRLAGRDDTPSVLSADDPGIAHVHGLGLNPADDSLFVATHYGTFRLGPDKKAERIGDSYQDTMGFTVAGAGRLLGSGHPDLQAARRGQPTRLGLIESTDGAVHRSTDGGASWSAAGRLPGAPEALLVTATTWFAAAKAGDGATGIYRSTDGGRNWDLHYRDPT